MLEYIVFSTANSSEPTMQKLIIFLSCLVSLTGISIAQETETKEPLSQEARMAWFRDAKFGMFTHWGVYSQAGGQWNGETHHHEWLQLTAKIPLAEYTEFAKGFTPHSFDADKWVQVAKAAGMKYLVITAKHHDGFAIYDSASSTHDIVDVSKFDRDPLKELAAACKKHGLKFCVYYSLGRDWEDPDVPTGRGEKVGFRSNLVDYPDEGKKFSRVTSSARSNLRFANC